MIEGDIDLTEDLDFYREKYTLEDKVFRNHRHKNPWQDKVKKLFDKKTWLNKTSKDSNAIMYSGRSNEYYGNYYSISPTNSYSNRWILSDTIYPMNVIYNISFASDNEGYSVNVSDTSDNDDTEDYIESSYNNNYTINYCGTNFDYLYSGNYWTNLTSTTTSGDSLQLAYKEEFSFSKRRSSYKKYREEYTNILCICPICKTKFIDVDKRYGYCKKCSKNYDDDLLMDTVSDKIFHRISGRYIYRDDSEYKQIELEEFLSTKRKPYFYKKDTSKKYWRGEKAVINIPWLKKLSIREYNDYIKELEEGEQDYSSYLTNMGWIGVHRTIHALE